MEPENTPLEKENHLPNHPFSGAMLVSGRVRVYHYPKRKATTMSLNGGKCRLPGKIPWVTQGPFLLGDGNDVMMGFLEIFDVLRLF